MNVTELARQLKVDTSEMLEKLPALGFDIGKRAIKVDDMIAAKIIDAWKRAAKEKREMKKIAEIRGNGEEKEEEVEKEVQKVSIPSVITVREFATVLDLPVNQVLSELMKNGVLVSMNERIDFDTASIIGEGLGFEILEAEGKEENTSTAGQEKLKEVLEVKDGAVERPPVVVVMGHVDHGKTKILDAIRKTDVVAGESGGITQHIGAYQVHKNDRLITFIDTPGHEAFTAMRSRGARVADVAIIVIAADDSIQPQTKEAIKIAQDAGLPFVIAINKIDKPEANVEKVKQDLSTMNLLPEEWGGKVVTSEVSALAGTGIDDLLETVLLVADLEKENLMANADRLAIGTIVESHVDKGEGPVATILVQAGTLRVGDVLGFDGNYYGKVRSLKDYKGNNIEEAQPGTPTKILGLKMAPEVGSVMEAAKDRKELARNLKKQKSQSEKDLSVLSRKPESEDDKTKYINLIIKADVLGSLEAIIESLAKLETENIKIKVIAKGLGIITEADVLKAEASGAKILGFHIKPTVAVVDLARDKKVDIKSYEIIYHLIEDIEKDMEGLKEVETVKKLIGKMEILKVFRKEAKNMIVGGRVTEGGLALSDIVIVVRGDEPITSGKVNRLECSKQQTEKVAAGQECGINFEGSPVIEEGDVLEFYVEEIK